MSENNKLTSDLKQFEEQLKGNNDTVQYHDQSEVTKRNLIKVKKNQVIAFPHGYSGCGYVRCHTPFYYLNSVFAKQNKLRVIVTPTFVSQKDLLIKASTLWFQRTMDPRQVPIVKEYKRLQNQLKYNMVYDIDDFVWSGDREGECIPEYNFGKKGITKDVEKAANEIMSMMDTICVSSEFLGDYINNELKIDVPVDYIPNAIPNWFIGTYRKPPIQEKIKIPTIIYTGSPTHYRNKNKMLGDWDNAWLTYVKKEVKSGKIKFICMGGLPWFFEEIKDCDNFVAINWMTSTQYYMPLVNYHADFSIGPLVPNFFNYSKSCIKMQEAYATGSVFIGSTFQNGYPSPYDVSFLNLSNNCTESDIDGMITEYCEPDKYNEILEKQYREMDEQGWWLESPKYVNKLCKHLTFKKSRWEK